MTEDEKSQYIDWCYERESLTPESVKKIYDFCRDQNSEIRMRATELLGFFPDEETEKLLLTMMEDPNYLVRVAACEALSFSESVNTLTSLMQASRDKNVLVRGYAVLSIANVQKNISTDVGEIVNYMKNLLETEKNEWVKIALYKSLLVLGESAYKDLFLKQIENKYYRLRCLALSLLDELLEDGIMEMTLILKQYLEDRYILENTYAVKDKLSRILNEYVI